MCSSIGMSAKFIYDTLFDTMHLFHQYQFEVRALLCDGSSTNLCAIKLLTGFGSGAFGTRSPGNCGDIHLVKTSFLNQFDNRETFTLICPSEQV